MKEKYIPGEGCECSARCSCECGCDVDWTPREVYELREQRDRLAEALKDVMKYRKGEEPYDYWRLPESHRRNVQFDGWNEIENRINAALAAVKG
jgi:hypothetical protein